jgi:tRNA(Ile)-lysidine synthase
MAGTVHQICKSGKVQGLGAKKAAMVEKVIDAIKKNRIIHSGDAIVVGISGGPDSVCLLHLLCSLRESMELKLYAAHVNHLLRGEESDEDESYVRDFCEKLNVELKTVHADIKKLAGSKGISLEEAGRIVRYELFDNVAHSFLANKIAVAHNKNDQAETVIMNIIRGAGLDGLKAMEHINGRIIRPLLGIERKEIEDYCILHKLNPRIDSSNLENIYTRNKVRLDLVPHINKLFNADIVHSITKMSDLIKDESEYIDNCVLDLYNKTLIRQENDEFHLKLQMLQKCHIAAKRRIIRNYIKEVRGNIKGIENIHIDSIIDLVDNGKTGSMLHLPGGLRVRKYYKTFKIYEESSEKAIGDFDLKLVIPGVTHINELDSCIYAEVLDDFNIKELNELKEAKSNSMEQFFDYDKTIGGINVRRRKDGDIIKPLKSIGTKKLKEYFIDNKIPRDLRDKIPLVAIGKEIIWIIGYKINDKFKATENTKKVLKLTYKKNI